jgi:uncharacterized hydrophobic protein (TIGR00271 family)
LYKKVFLIKSQAFDELEIDEVVQYVEQNYEANVTKVVLETFLDLEEFDESALYLCYLTNDGLKQFIAKTLYKNLDVGIIANKECTKAIKSYNLIGNYKELIQNAMEGKNLSTIDVLTANETVVYQSVQLGNIYGMTERVLPDDSLFKRIKRFFLHLKNIKFTAYRLQSQNETQIDTVATGILIYEHNLKADKDSLINEDISLHDGQLNAVVLAPKSIVSFLYLLFVLFFYKKFSLSKLPKSVGLIKTESLKVSSNTQGIDYLIDGVGVSAKEVVLKVNKDAFKLFLSQSVDETFTQENEEEKKEEVLKIGHLPQGEYKKLLLKNTLPLFQKAQSDDFKELFLALKDASRANTSYIVLMIFSTLIATVGLFLNSGPVIIGAMILAPLMAPIVSLSMGVVRDDDKLSKQSLSTIVIGIALAVFSAALFTLAMPTLLQTEQIQSRLQPNLLDLFVAIFSGVAAAYANAKEEVAKSLAGVAIAVALVPPLAVTGIGLGWMEYEVIKGSFLLFITNLVGITIASSLTFVILGYAPLVRAKKGIIYTSAMLVAVSIPLAFAFFDIVGQNVTYKKIMQNTHIEIDGADVEYKVTAIETTSDEIIKIELEVTAKQPLTKQDYTLIKELFEKSLDANVELKITTKIII